MRPWALVLPLLLLAGGGCKQEEPAPERTLYFAMQSDYDSQTSLHPFRSFLMNDAPLFNSLYSSLFMLDERLQPRPFLLDRWEKRGSEIHFFLRRGIRFSNGRPVTSADAVWSIVQSIRNPDVPNPIYTYMAEGERIFRGESEGGPSIGALDPGSFFIRFKEANDLFPYYLTSRNTPIVPAGWTSERPVFSGPYRLERTERRGDRTRVYVGANPHFPGGPQKRNRICFEYCRNPADFEALVKGGHPDLFLNFMRQGLPTHPDYQILRTPALGGLYIRLNPNRGALRRREFRRSLLRLVDFFTLAGRKHWETFSPATHILPYGLEEYFILNPLEAPQRRPEPQASPVRLKTTNFRSSIREELVGFWQQQLQAYNIELQPEWVPSREFWLRFRENDYESASFYFTLDIPLAIYFYEALFTPGLELNPGYRNERALRLIDEYRRIPPGLRRVRIVAELEEIAREEALLIPVYNMVVSVGYKKGLRGVRSNPLMTIPVEEIRIEKGN